jgi:hypothetical protein
MLRDGEQMVDIYMFDCWKQIFLSMLPQNILRIFKHLRKWRSLYMRETLYIGIASSLQTSGFVKCFIHKISLSIVTSWIIFRLIAKTRLFLFWLFEYSFDSYSLLFFWILSILSENNFNTQTYAFAIMLQR